MRSTRSLALALVPLAVLACTKVKDTPIIDDKKPLPRPADLLYQGSLPGLDGTFAGLGDYADQVKPGASALIKTKLGYAIAELGGLTSLDGVKGDAPLWMIMLNPKVKGPREVLLVGVGDEKKLRESAKNTTLRVQGGWAVVGTKESVEALAPYALATLAKQTPPKQATVTVYTKVLRSAYKDEMAQFRKTIPMLLGAQGGGGGKGPDLARMLGLEMDAIEWILDNSDALEVSLDVNREDANLQLAAVPSAGTTLAKYVAAQKPFGAGLLGRLPPARPAVVVAGNIAVAPIADQLLPGISQLMVALVPQADAAVLDKFMRDLIAAASGDFAMLATFDEGGLQMRELLGVDDAARAQKATSDFATSYFAGAPKTIEVGTAKLTTKPLAPGMVVDGVAVSGSEQTFTPGNPDDPRAAAAQRMTPAHSFTYFGVIDDVLAMCTGAADAKAMKDVIAAARGKGPHLVLDASLQRMVDGARQRGESAVAVIDVLQILSGGGGVVGGVVGGGGGGAGGVVMAFGFQGGRASVRLEAPSALVKLVAK